MRIVLLPSSKLDRISREYSSLITRKFPSFFNLNKAHIPHVTLAKFERKTMLSTAKDLLKDLSKTRRISIKIKDVSTYENFISIYFKENKRIYNIRSRLKKSSFAIPKYKPHITLTRLKSSNNVNIALMLLKSFPISTYVLDKIAICEDAEHGTCKKIVTELKLK